MTSHTVLAVVILFTFFSPTNTNAGVLSSFTGKIKSIFLAANDNVGEENSNTAQNMPIFKPVVFDDEENPEDGATSSSDTLSITSGALRISTEDIDYPTDDTISVYEVKKGDTLSTVAKLFGVSKNTIMWANDLKSEKISSGDILVILPITGIRHTIKKGDTISTIAKKYKADIDDISKFNGISKESKLVVGDTVIVPEGEIAVPVVKKSVSTGKVTSSYANSTLSGFLIRPIAGGRKTQGLHGHNGIDLGASKGTPVFASAGGQVIVAKSSGYNGGYGQMIVITHDNGIQTVYAHLNAVYVTSGQTVSQGQTIGEVGNTGKSTGAHLHFEVRGAKNPF